MSGYTSAETHVFWDLEDFPVPHGGDLYAFHDNVVKALEDEYYRSEVSITAYSAHKTSHEVDHFRYAEIPIVFQANDKRRRFNKMLMDMAHWTFSKYPSKDEDGHQVNLIVVAKDIPEKGSAMYSVLKELDDGNYSVFFVLPDDGPVTTVSCTPEELLALPVFIWRWGSFFAGGAPVESYEPADFEFVTPKRKVIDIDSQGSSRGLKNQKTDAASC